MVKGGNFTSLNADWGAEIIGGSLEVGELLKSRGRWAPTQPTPPPAGWQTLDNHHIRAGFPQFIPLVKIIIGHN